MTRGQLPGGAGYPQSLALPRRSHRALQIRVPQVLFQVSVERPEVLWELAESCRMHNATGTSVSPFLQFSRANWTLQRGRKA